MKAARWLCLLALALCLLPLPPGAVLHADDRPLVGRYPTGVIEAQAVAAISSLADPAKLATLGERQANPRVQKITFWLLATQNVGGSPEAVIDAAFASFGWKGTRKGLATKQTMMVNIGRARALGCDDGEGMESMRGGHAPIVRRGPYTGDKMSVDHVLPFALFPQLDHVLANLELMPLRMNESKSATIAERQNEMAARLRWAGLLDAPAAPPATAPPVAKPAASAASTAFAGSSRSPVFHKSTCPSVAKIVPSNLVLYPTREAALAADKRPCPQCKP